MLGKIYSFCFKGSVIVDIPTLLIATVLALFGNKHAIFTGRSFAIYQSDCGFIIVRLFGSCIFILRNKTVPYLQSYCVIVCLCAGFAISFRIIETRIAKTTLIAGANVDIYQSAFVVVILVTRV